jgi:Polyketide cyclase / dehydrase and lipid transport
MTVTLEARVDIDAAPEVVWAAVTDWPAQGKWIPGTVVGVVEGDGRSVGSRLFAFTGVADIGFLDIMEITEWQPPHRCQVRHLGRLLRGYGLFAVEPRGQAATFVWAEELQPPFGLLGHAGLWLGRPVFEALLRRAARTLAAWCVSPR